MLLDLLCVGALICAPLVLACLPWSEADIEATHKEATRLIRRLRA